MSASPITILVPVYNRARALAVVMPSYWTQRGVAKIVLVDDGSSDATFSVMQQMQAQSALPVQIIRHDRKRGQPQARITALGAADTEWVLFGEDDVALASDYAQTLLTQAQQASVDLIAGRLVNVGVNGAFDLAQIMEQDRANLTIPDDPGFDWAVFRADYHARPRTAVSAPFLHSVTLIRRAVFERVAFDPDYRGNAVREETDFYLSAAALGYGMLFTPDTACYHLRGPIAATGGQRMSRARMEFWNLVNTRRLVTKHWAHLSRAHGFRGSPTRWMLGYVWQRYRHVIGHMLRAGTLRPKDRL